MNSVNIMGKSVTTAKVEALVGEALKSKGLTIINTINPHSYVAQRTDLNFSLALDESDYLIPDGAGISLAANLLHKIKMKRISGYDLFCETMRNLEQVGGKVFFLGASEDTLALIKERAQREYPTVSIVTLSPPYKEKFSSEDIESFISAINLAEADVLWVGLTAPKQECLIQAMKNVVNVKMASGIGAVFDFYAGTVSRAPNWVIRLNLEWLHRSLSSWRLAKRNIISNPKFVLYLIKEYFK